MVERLGTVRATLYLGVGANTFRRMVASGAIHYAIAHDGRRLFTRADLDDYLERYARIRPGELRHNLDRGPQVKPKRKRARAPTVLPPPPPPPPKVEPPGLNALLPE